MNNRLILINFALAGLALLVLSYTVWHLIEQQRFGQEVTQVQSPQGLSVRIEQSRDGHYRFRGEINGQPVRFLLDTGASLVAIPRELASELALQGGERIITQTANGQSSADLVMLSQVAVGDIRLNQVQGAISHGFEGREILLGMSFLKHLELVQRDRALMLRVP